MTQGRAILYALLLVTASALSLGTRAGAEAGPGSASARSHAGGGLAALSTWLRESGAEVQHLERTLTELPPGLSTVVVAAPAAARISQEEAESLSQFVSRGGRLVYLRASSGQPTLDGWLQLDDAGELEGAPQLADPGGATAVIAPARGLLAGLSSFRVGTRRGVSSGDPQFLPVARVGMEPAMLWRPEGRGEIIVAAGADVAENRRLELGDNRVFWARLAALGPIAFDEFHHVTPPAPPLSIGIWAFGLQAVLCAVLLALTRGTHLGPPRTPAPLTHRRAMEYAESFGRLLRGARVEGALLTDLESRLRRVLRDRAGVPLHLDAEQAGVRLRAQREELARSWEAFRAERAASSGRISPGAWWRLSRLAAELESQLRGEN